jgi:hypothetical protein
LKYFSLKKMRSAYDGKQAVQYSLSVNEELVPLNPYLGKSFRIKASGEIHCVACGRKTSKSYQQGYCFPCTQKLAQCDLCIVKPELCHFHKGTCREPDWAQAHCMIPHVVYLANSSGLKVGITREHQKLTRWIDQGAVQALAVARVKQRLDAGLIESYLKKDYADRTDWRAMLKGEAPPLDLTEAREEVLGALPLTLKYEAMEEDETVVRYPILEYPQKVQSLNLEKTPVVEGTLLGIKGQYLILDRGVLNIRSFSGYQIELGNFLV